jgi:uncharacterized membrane protein
MNLTLRLAVSAWIGILSSLIVNFAALEYIWKSHSQSGRFAAIFFAVGSWLAPRGFEGQILTLSFNVLGFAVGFGVASYLLLGLRKRAISN